MPQWLKRNIFTHAQVLLHIVLLYSRCSLAVVVRTSLWARYYMPIKHWHEKRAVCNQCWNRQKLTDTSDFYYYLTANSITTSIKILTKWHQFELSRIISFLIKAFLTLASSLGKKDFSFLNDIVQTIWGLKSEMLYIFSLLERHKRYWQKDTIVSFLE